MIDDLMAVVAVISGHWIQLNRGTRRVINFPAGGGRPRGEGGGWMWFCYYSS